MLKQYFCGAASSGAVWLMKHLRPLIDKQAEITLVTNQLLNENEICKDGTYQNVLESKMSLT